MLTKDELDKLLEYNHHTGNFIRKKNIAGAKHHSGYIYIKVKGKRYSAHRLAWLTAYGSFPNGGMEIDHINGNRADNRIGNLRLASKSQNAWNTRIRKDNTSGIKGISWCKDISKWRARINYKGKQKLCSYFDDIELAKNFLQISREKLHEKYANNG